ncbi:MAG: hypothetical protein Q9226_002888 [Calogaya cf. arnoldii]
MSKNSCSVSLISILLFLLSLSQAKPLDRTPNALSTVPSGNALRSRSYTTITTSKYINITHTRITEYTYYSHGPSSFPESSNEIVNVFQAGISTDISNAQLVKRVLKAGVSYHYGNFKMQMIYLGFGPQLKAVEEFAEENWNWGTVLAISQFVKDVIVEGIPGAVKMILELASGVDRWITDHSVKKRQKPPNRQTKPPICHTEPPDTVNKPAYWLTEWPQSRTKPLHATTKHSINCSIIIRPPQYHHPYSIPNRVHYFHQIQQEYKISFARIDDSQEIQEMEDPQDDGMDIPDYYDAAEPV